MRLDHVVFPIWDAGASLAFYADVLGLPLVSAISGDDWGGAPWLMLIFALADGRELVLVALRGAERPAPDRLPADVRHYAFSVASRSDQDGWKEGLGAAGVAFTEEDHGSQHSVYFSDPNGVVLEITTPPSAPPSVPDPRAHASAKAWIDGPAS